MLPISNSSCLGPARQHSHFCPHRPSVALPSSRLLAVRASPAVVNGDNTIQASSSCTVGRRNLLLGLSTALIVLPAVADDEEAKQLQAYSIKELEEGAFEAYATRDFTSTDKLLDEIILREPELAKWWEMRAQVKVDGKDFSSATQDFDQALALTPESELIVRARLLSGRALALEGLSDWKAALRDYDLALELAGQGGESPDPYVINSRGNCYNSLGNWQEAREDYLLSSRLFQTAKGFRGRDGSTTQRLDGAIFSASNAALMLAQMGNREEAIKEMERIARRAPGSADMRAALAALYYDRSGPGDRERAEGMWNFACTNIAVGCSKFQDPDFLGRIRRWPPVMVDRMQAFLKLTAPPTSAKSV